MAKKKAKRKAKKTTRKATAKRKPARKKATKKRAKKAAKPARSTKADNETLVAFLAYIIIGIIWYFSDDKLKNNSLAKFHTKQALNLIILLIVLRIVFGMLFWIPFLMTLINILFFILWIVGIVCLGLKFAVVQRFSVRIIPRWR